MSSRRRTSSSSSLSDGEFTGRGEAAGVYYLGDDVDAHRRRARSASRCDRGWRRTARSCARSCRAAARATPSIARCGSSRRSATGTEARQPRRARASRKPLITTFTLGADDPEVMAEGARRYADARAIKVKLTGELELDIARVAAQSAPRGPTSGSASTPTRASRATQLDRARRSARAQHRVSLLEQPLPRGREADLDGYRSPDPDRRRRKRARPRRRRRAASAASTSSTSSSTSAAASPRRC